MSLASQCVLPVGMYFLWESVPPWIVQGVQFCYTRNLFILPIILFHIQCARPLSLTFASHSSPYLINWRGYLACLALKMRWTGGVPSTKKKVYIKIFQMAKCGARYLMWRECSSSGGLSMLMEGNVHQMENCELELPSQWIGVWNASPCCNQLMHN